MNSSSSSPFRYTLNKSERIKSKKLIDELFDKGSSFFLQSLRVVYIAQNHEEAVSCKVAFTVSKRNFKKAVDRNRVKRLMRECFRLNKKNLHEHLQSNQKKVTIAFIYSKNVLPEYADMNILMQECLKKLISKT